MYRDRRDGGRVLAEHLQSYKDAAGTIVLGIPRGGVVVAAEVADALRLPLDIAVAAKVGSPGNPEYAVGALAPDGEVTANPAAGYALDEVRAIAQPAHAKIERYMSMLRGHSAPLDVRGKTILLVDDGLATGLTARAAAEWLKRQGAGKVVVAIPVASASAVRDLRRVADEVLAVQVPEDFYAVGQFYERFGQTEDDEVRSILGSMNSEEARHDAVHSNRRSR